MMTFEEFEKLNPADKFSWERYYRFNPIMQKMIAHGPVYGFCVKNECMWLLDVIGSAQLKKKVREEYFQFWHIKVNPKNSSAVVWCTDGDKGDGEITLYKQEIPYTDLKIDSKDTYYGDYGSIQDNEMTLYCIEDGCFGEKPVNVIVFPEDR